MNGKAKTKRPTIERLREAFSYDASTGELRWKAPCKGRVRPSDLAGGLGSGGYRLVSVDGFHVRAHSIVWAMHYGVWQPKGSDIDHVNRDKGDNRIENLRLATRSQNNFNSKKPKSNRSGHKNVYRHSQSGAWVVHLRANGNRIHVGCFHKLEDAAAAAEAARNLYHGEFASNGGREAT